MRGDIDIRCAYGTGLSIAAAVKNLSGAAIDITGYSSRLIVQHYDDSGTWATVLTLTSGGGQITNGGATGIFTATISGANSTALAAYFGSPTPTRQGRFEMYATPPAGTETLILHGWVKFLVAGEAVDPISVDVYEDSFSVSVTALAPAGADGPAGPDGPEGPPLLVANQLTTLPARAKHRPGGYTRDDGSSTDQTVEDIAQEDIRKYGATSTAIATTITATAGSSTATFGTSAAVNKLKLGDWIFCQLAGADPGWSAPAAPTVIQQGTKGLTTVSVRIAYYSRLMGFSALSPATVITDANATLSALNYIEVWHDKAAARLAGADYIIVYVQFAGSGGTHTYRGGIIASPMPGLGNSPVVTSFRLHSTSAVTAPTGIPASSVGFAATKNGMWTQLTSDLNGSNVASISPALKTSVTAANCFPCAVPAILDAIKATTGANPITDTGGKVVIPVGIFYCTQALQVDYGIQLLGASSGQTRSGASLRFYAGAWLQTNCRTTGIKRSPGEPLRVGDYRISTYHSEQPGAATENFYRLRVKSIAASATWGFTAGGAEPSYDYSTEGATTVDGDITFEAVRFGSTADGSGVYDIVLEWDNLTLPVSQYSVPDDLQQQSWNEKRSPVGTSATGGWAAGIVYSSSNKWVQPPAGSETGKWYEATTPGTAGGAAPTFPRTNGATVNDGTAVLTCRDAPRQQGVGAVFCCRVDVDIGIGGQVYQGVPGTSWLLNGNPQADGSQCNGSNVRVQTSFSAGHAGAICGSDAQTGNIYLVTSHNSGLDYQDDSFFGNFAYVRSGGGTLLSGQIGYGGAFGLRTATGCQNRRKDGTQQHCYLEGYVEGTPAHDWNYPGVIGDGYNMHGLISGATGIYRGAYLAGYGSFSQDLAVVRQWSAQQEQFGSVTGTPSARTAWQEQRDFVFSSGKLFTRMRSGTTDNVWAQRVYSARGRLVEFLKGIIRGDAELLDTSILAIPTLGAFKLGDQLWWGNDNSRVMLRPSQQGCIGQTARANSTAYAQGSIYTSSSKCFVVVSCVSSSTNGTTASSPPAGLAAASAGTFVQDGTLWVECWGTDQDPLLYAIPDLSSDPVALAASNSTVQISQGNVRACATPGANITTTLGTTGVTRGDTIRFRRTDTAAFTWDIGGLITMPSGVRSTAQVRYNGSAWVRDVSWLEL